MVQKSNEPILRKLSMPLEVRIGNDTVITDGVFSLTCKDASQINLVGIDPDGFVKVEILPPKEILSSAKTRSRITDFVGDEASLIGQETSRARGRGTDFGIYKYYRKPDGDLFAVVSGSLSKKGMTRMRTFQVGRIADKGSTISIYLRTIKQNFNTNEFSKKQLMSVLPKNLGYGQIVKSTLDILKLEGYIEKREIKPQHGRLKELFRATTKMHVMLVPVNPEQA